MDPVVAAPPELIDVRTDERFDERRLGEWLRGPRDDSEQPLAVRQFGGGHGVVANRKLSEVVIDPLLDFHAVDDPGRCVAVHDWAMCTLGDLLCALGARLGLRSNRGEVLAGSNPMSTQTPGCLSREQAAARYAERSGRSAAQLP